MNVNGVEFPDKNPINQQPWVLGDTTIGPDGKMYVYNGMTFIVQETTPSQQGQDNIALGTGSEPNVLFGGKTTYDPGTGQTAPGLEEKSWASAIDFMASLRNKKDQTEYNRYANALKNSPFWSGGKKISRSAVDSAWKSALYSSAVDNLVVQDLLFNKDVQNVAAGNESATGKYNNISYYTNVINRTAVQQGVTLDPKQVKDLASQAMSNSWDTATLQQNIAKTGTLDFAKGSAAEQLNSLKELAGSYGVQFNQDWYNTAVSNVLTGKDNIETYKQYVKDQAKSKYPTLSEQIDKGFTVRQLASSYTNAMANLLEIDEQSIKLDDYYINQALTGLDEKGNPVQKPLWQFQQDIRKNDPRWRSTKNAEEAMMSASRKVLQDFGLVS